MSPGKAQRKGITFMELLKMFPDDATAQVLKIFPVVR